MSKHKKSNALIIPISNPERDAIKQRQREQKAYSDGWNAWILSTTSTNPFEEGCKENELWASGALDAKNAYGSMRSIGMNYSHKIEQGEQDSRVIGVPKKRGRPPKQKAAGQTQTIKESVPRRFSFQAA
jgi:hypothetical protein